MAKQAVQCGFGARHRLLRTWIRSDIVTVGCHTDARIRRHGATFFLHGWGRAHLDLLDYILAVLDAGHVGNVQLIRGHLHIENTVFGHHAVLDVHLVGGTETVE